MPYQKSSKKLIFTNLEVALAVIPVAILSKLIRYFILSDKLIDSSSANSILELVLDPNFSLLDKGTNSFNFAAAIFKFINFFNFNTVYQWEIYLTIIFNIVLMIFILKCYHYINVRQCLFLLASAGLLNMFVFNLGKDILQFVIFILVFAVLKTEKLSQQTRLILSCAVLLISGLWFRVYYVLIAGFTLYFYFVMRAASKIIKSKWKQILAVFAIFYVSFFIVTVLMKLISPHSYNILINIRENTLSNLLKYGSYPETAIKELIVSNNILAFFINHMISVIRMILPVELIFKGIKYIPFVIFQCIVVYNIVFIAKHKSVTDDEILPAVAICIGFLLGSAVFEPDFGSWVRHEIAIFPVLYIIFEFIDKETKTAVTKVSKYIKKEVIR